MIVTVPADSLGIDYAEGVISQHIFYAGEDVWRTWNRPQLIPTPLHKSPRMTTEHKFAFGDSVTITEIQTRGIVRAVRFDRDGLGYFVTYWWEGKMQEVWLTEPELSP